MDGLYTATKICAHKGAALKAAWGGGGGAFNKIWPWPPNLLITPMIKLNIPDNMEEYCRELYFINLVWRAMKCSNTASSKKHSLVSLHWRPGQLEVNHFTSIWARLYPVYRTLLWWSEWSNLGQLSSFKIVRGNVQSKKKTIQPE